jgi:hypothetical protein
MFSTSSSHDSDVVLLSQCPRYSLQITSEDTLFFSNQETKAEMLEEWKVAACQNGKEIVLFS